MYGIIIIILGKIPWTVKNPHNATLIQKKVKKLNFKQNLKMMLSITEKTFKKALRKYKESMTTFISHFRISNKKIQISTKTN